MEERVLEHEILSALFTLTGFAIKTIGSEKVGHLAIFKRTYSHCSLQFGTLVDILNNPHKYKTRPANESNITYLQDKKTKLEEVEIKDFDWYVVSDALELLKHKDHISDDAATSIFENIKDRQITLTYLGVIAFLDKYYLKEHKKAELSKLDEERLNLDVFKLQNEYFDYPTTKQRAKDSYIISILTIIVSVLALLVSVFK